jgi:ABC-type antimicrobial peptide transport system permease subunit
LTDGLRIAGVGIVVGLALAAVLTRSLGGFLYGVEPFDPLTFSVVPLLLIAIALAACAIPARRAMGVDPMTALRDE